MTLENAENTVKFSIKFSMGRGVADDSTDNVDIGVTGRLLKLDTGSDFFSVGAPLHAVRAGYVKRRADDLLFENVSVGRYAHVLAPDRSGKSSLIAATAARLEGSGCKVAILDLAQIGVRNAGSDSGRWYYNVAYRLLRQLRIRYDLQEWWQDKSFLSNRQRLLEFYSEVILHHIPEPIVIFVDEIQHIHGIPDAEQLLASIRAAHNARTTNPDFSRLCFALFGECDPVSLVEEPELSPFNVTQQVLLDDFSRADLDVFRTELNLGAELAATALDRIFYWTNGQPYLSQKLARAVSREAPIDDVGAFVDRVALHQLAGRAALHSEPHMSHIHRGIVNDTRRSEALLNLYGKLRKGVPVAADLGSALQRRLMAIGLVIIDEESNLRVRNRLYASVFTARWANENLPLRLKVPTAVAAGLLLLGLIPFWYTQWLPNPYVRELSNTDTEISRAAEAYRDLNSFPGHGDIAENFYRSFLERRAEGSSDIVEISELAQRASLLPNANRLPDELEARYWERQASAAMRVEDRDTALLSKIQALVLSTSNRRQSAAALLGDDYPLLLATLPGQNPATTVFDPKGMVLTTAIGASISQWSYTAQGIRERGSWSATALEVEPLVRRVIVDREGFVNRAGLTLNLSHARLADLRIKIIAPSGRIVEVEPGLQQASAGEDIRIPAAQLSALVGEAVSGTWSISLRDEGLGVAGQLVGWNLKLNSQGAVEYFQRGLNIPDPREQVADKVWFDSSGRYAVARASQSDTARIWDLAFAEPIRAVAITENESLVGLDAAGRLLVTATQETVNVWDTGSGDKLQALPVGAPSAGAVLTPSGQHVFVQRQSDADTQLELWSLQSGLIVAEVTVAGVPAQVAIDHSGSRVAIADFDRAIRVWDFETGALLGQFDMPAQASEMHLSADGSALGVVLADSGVSLWSIAQPAAPLLQLHGHGDWSLRFSPSGALLAAGRSDTGYHLYSGTSGEMLSPALGVRPDSTGAPVLSFSQDEQLLLTGDAARELRFWQVATASLSDRTELSADHAIWDTAADSITAVSPNGDIVAIGDRQGHVHFVSTVMATGNIEQLNDEISYLGHRAPIAQLALNSAGDIAASTAADNSVRVWDALSGEPKPFDVELVGSPIKRLVFSPDSKYLATMNSERLTILSVQDGRVVSEIALPDEQHDLTFASQGEIYLGGESGALLKVNQSTETQWDIQQVWQGADAIVSVQVSPRGDHLVLVDRQHVASQFVLSEGRIAAGILQLPSSVKEIVFGRHGNRVFFRTSRWVHRGSVSPLGLHWIDAILVPPALPGSGLVFGNGAGEAASPTKLYLPVAAMGRIRLHEVNPSSPATSGLFGTKEELLQEWQSKVSAPLRAEF